jgi:hypothetical protein
MTRTKWTQSDARNAVAETLRLSLHGPTGAGPALWPGFSGEAKLIAEGSIIPSEYKFDLPMHDGRGNEVIVLTPSVVYGIGVLYPRLNDVQHAQLTAEQRQPQLADDSDEKRSELNEVVELEVDPDADVRDELIDADEESKDNQVHRPQSMAFSIHVPNDLGDFEVWVRGATYEKMSIMHGTRLRQVWRRRYIEAKVTFERVVTQSLSVTADNCTAPEDWPDHLKLTVGLTAHEGSHAGTLCTFYVLNQSEVIDDVSSSCVFQIELEARVADLLPYPSQSRIEDATEASFDLLYRKKEIMAVGHGCDAEAIYTDNGWRVRSDVLPLVEVQPTDPEVNDANGQSYAIGMLDLGLDTPLARSGIEKIISDYAAWLEEETQKATGLQGGYAEAAARHLSAAGDFLADVRDGWSLFTTNGEVNRVLRWASLAMNAQRTSSSLSIRLLQEDGSFVFEGPARIRRPLRPNLESDEYGGFGKSSPDEQGSWRAFQIAFVLSSLRGIISDDAEQREVVDVIWMPTGGGKTEAYLGLAGFTILWERRQQVLSGEAPVSRFYTSVLMRYTYRLLTTQQVLRAASLICALEIVRRSNLEFLDPEDKAPIRIGAWLGGKTTPNSREQAVRQWDAIAFERNRFGGKFLLTRCPWCAAEMGRGFGGKVLGYQKAPMQNRSELFVKPVCPDSECPFSGSIFTRIPVLEVDEDIYQSPPAFIVGTVDKFARLSWETRAARIFGLAQRGDEVQRVAPPPTLLIQDELHLISGPLGSMDAMFEFVLEELCLAEGGIRPKIIGATATTRNFEAQTRHLYSRDRSRLLPPPGIEISDSFFARTSENPERSKYYMGICAPGLGSVVEAQLRVIASLVHAAAALEQTESPSADPWWTNLCFFSSRRSLALQKAACQTELRNRTWTLAQRSGVRTGVTIEPGSIDAKPENVGQRRSVRNIRQIRELTATSTDNIGELLEDLGSSREADNSVDICFATSMIEVGVDVPRLGLMTVMGQPKSSSQYIQVTGRVGRNENSPGLVVVVLSPHSVRDRSHFESFRSNHERLYASVESVSVTPFTPQALERTCAGALTALYRALLPGMNPFEAWESELGGSLRLRLEARARKITNGNQMALDRLREEFKQLEGAVRANAAVQATWDQLLVMAGSLEEVRSEFEVWIAPNSMRNVEPESGLRIMATDLASRKPNAGRSSHEALEDGWSLE